MLSLQFKTPFNFNFNSNKQQNYFKQKLLYLKLNPRKKNVLNLFIASKEININKQTRTF